LTLVPSVRTRLTTARHMMVRRMMVIGACLIAVMVLVACQPGAIAPIAPAENDSDDSEAPATLVVYSGRNENLVGPLIEQFSADTGIPVQARYGGTAEMAVTILEEGSNSPADVFFAQDAGALGELSRLGRLSPLPDDIVESVEPALRSQSGDWIGVSGRARVLVYNVAEVSEDALPDTIWGLLDPQWQSRIGWAPTNASFQSFVTALRVLEGEERAREWLEGMIANDVQVYPNNTTIVAAAASGEILVGLVNHYYLYRFLSEEGEDFGARNHTFPVPNAGSMMNIAGVGILDSASNRTEAEAFVRYLLSPAAQQYFLEETTEYALTDLEVTTPEFLTPLAEIPIPTELDLSDLDDLQGTLELLQDVGALN
jgi:iron(III) transport system substrate-binding protein